MDKGMKFKLGLGAAGAIVALIILWVFRSTILWALGTLAMLAAGVGLVALVASIVLSRKGDESSEAWKSRIPMSGGLLGVGVVGYILVAVVSSIVLPSATVGENGPTVVDSQGNTTAASTQDVNLDALSRMTKGKPSDKWQIAWYMDGEKKFAVVPPADSGKKPYGIALTNEWQILRLDNNVYGFVPPEGGKGAGTAIDQRDFWAMTTLTSYDIVAFVPPVGSESAPVIAEPKDVLQIVPLGSSGLAVIPTKATGRIRIGYGFTDKDGSAPSRWLDTYIPGVVTSREAELRFVDRFLAIAPYRKQDKAEFHDINGITGGEVFLTAAKNASEKYTRQLTGLLNDLHNRVVALGSLGLNYRSSLSSEEQRLANQDVSQLDTRDLRPIVQEAIKKLDGFAVSQKDAVVAKIEAIKKDTDGTPIDIPANIVERAKAGEFSEVATILGELEPKLLEFYRKQASDELNAAKAQFSDIRIHDNISQLSTVANLKAKIEDIRKKANAATQKKNEKLAQIILDHNKQIATALENGLTELSVAKYRLTGNETYEEAEGKKKAFDSFKYEFGSKNKSEIAYSPDRKHVAFIRTHPASVVLDGDAGPVFREVVRGSIVFSNDSKRMAYIGIKENGTSVVVCDGKASEEYNRIIGRPSFSNDSKRVAFAASKGRSGSQLIVVDGQEGKRYTRILATPSFSPDSSSIAYIAQEGYAEFLVIDDKEYREYADEVGKRIREIIAAAEKRGDHVEIGRVKGNASMSISPALSSDWTRIGYSYTDHINDNEWSRYVVIDGKRFGPYDRVGGIFFSADSKRNGFWCQYEEVVDGLRRDVYQVIVDGVPGMKHKDLRPSSVEWMRVTNPNHLFGFESGVKEQQIPLFSEDGKHFAYNAEEGVVLDGKIVYSATEITSPLFFMPGTGKLAFVARHYINEKNDDEFCFVVDGKPGPTFDRIIGGRIGSTDPNTIAFSKDGHFAYIADIAGRPGLTLVVDHKPTRTYSDLRSLHFSDDGKQIAYMAIMDAGEWFVEKHAIDDQDSQPRQAHIEPLITDFKISSEMTHLIGSPDGKRIAFATKKQVTVDGKADKPYYVVAGSTLTFSPDGKRYAYVAGPDEGAVVVVDGQDGPVFKVIVDGPMFSGDSNHVAYTARTKDGKMVTVLNHKIVGEPSDIIYNLVISESGGQVGWIASAGCNQEKVEITADSVRDWKKLAAILKNDVNQKASGLEKALWSVIPKKYARGKVVSESLDQLAKIDPDNIDDDDKKFLLSLMSNAMDSEKFISQFHTSAKGNEDWILNGPLNEYVKYQDKRDPYNRPLPKEMYLSTSRLSDPQQRLLRRLCIEAIAQGALSPIQEYSVIANGAKLATADQIYRGGVLATKDGQSWFWIERRADGWHVMRDGKPIFGPLKQIDQFVISPEGKWLVAGIGNADYRVVVNGNAADLDCEAVKSVVFAADSIAYAAKSRDKWSLIYNGRSLGSWSDIRNIVLSNDGKMCAYAAQADDKWRLMNGAEQACRIMFNYDIRHIGFSADGNHLAFCGVNGVSESEQRMQMLNEMYGGSWKVGGRWKMYMGCDGEVYQPAYDFLVGHTSLRFDRGKVAALGVRNNTIERTSVPLK